MRLPLFPLHQVMFPNEVVALHIFEPRYRQMLKDVLAGDRTFGIVLIRSGWESGEPADPLRDRDYSFDQRLRDLS